ncbi:MAG TPA: DUF4129 domain-containing protein [Solirubrobacteraceae bacterium]|nr:DUF4129 domain-containing protein [Solirubrobacteraceae bacterium]
MALAVALTVVGLLLVTAIASRKPLSGEGQTVPPVGGGQSQINAPPWALVLVAAGALVALAGILVTVGWPLLRRRKKDEALVREFRISRTAKFVALLVPFALGAVLVAAAIEGSRARTPIRPHGNVVPRAGRAPKPGHFSSYAPPTWILPTVVGVVLLGAGAVLLVVAYRNRLGAGAEPEPDMQAATALSDAVEASLEDLRDEPDPRRAVIAAYRRMETTLADAGLPRRDWEAPREYSGRAHNHLELSARPLQTLTSLFERARFGVGRVGEPLREQAIAALSALREELRA